MARATIGDHRATLAEIEPHRRELRSAATRSGLERPRLRNDGTIIVGAPEPGYRAVVRFAGEAMQVVGTYVHVITDDVAGGQVDAPAL